MKKLMEILEANKPQEGAKLTKNNELYLDVLLGVLTDDTHKTEVYEGYEDGKVINVEKEIAKDFRSFVARILRIAGMTEEEALEAAAKYNPKKKEIGVLIDAIRETDYLMTAKLGKKVSIVKKADIEADFSIFMDKERTYTNPKDRSKVIVVAPKHKAKVHNIVHPWVKQQ